mmetsp:Transcript_54024/g.139120  ORF Transcript_54024/g.139120 Transcript_54024/m.139120 type:complete len:92 (+) Transcript_54024:256-531(+)
MRTRRPRPLEMGRCQLSLPEVQTLFATGGVHECQTQLWSLQPGGEGAAVKTTMVRMTNTRPCLQQQCCGSLLAALLAKRGSDPTGLDTGIE